MSEYNWEIELDGVTHNLLAVKDKRGSGYHLYDGDEYITNILPVVPFRMEIGIEQEFEIDGHTLYFVELIEYGPDIVYNGKMIGKDRDYIEAKTQFCKGKLWSYGVILMLMVILLIWYGVRVRLDELISVVPFAAFVIYKIIKFAKAMPRRISNDTQT